jgi:2-polyprenyl-3-methyl-5-hydroxy-6-metoxy-1,4-benzoquinol methylase
MAPTSLSFKCVVCGNADMPTLIEEHVRDDIVGILTVVQCPACQHVQLSPPEYDIELYEADGQVASVVSSYGTPLERVFEHSWVEAQRRVERGFGLQPRTSTTTNPLKILDVGGGYGFFATEVLSKFPDAEVSVLEPSALRIETGVARIKERCLDSFMPNFITGLLDDEFVAKNLGAFDAVTMWHVLEHVPDPAGLLQKALAIVKPEFGRVCVEVPNFQDELLSLSSGYRSRHFMREHISYFTPKALMAVAHKATSEAQVSVSGYQRYGIFNFVHWIEFNKPQGANPDLFPGEDRWWLEGHWRAHKEQECTSDALFMVLSPK